MQTGELIARGSVWIALATYPAGPLGCGLGEDPRGRRLRTVWAFGGAAFLLHAASSFGVFYDWSHGVALAETARLTDATTGRATGAGLWLNYLFTVLWIGDAAWWGLSPRTHGRRSPLVDRALHGFLLFLILNGAVIFVEGPRRLLGTVVTAAGLAALVASQRRRRRR